MEILQVGSDPSSHSSAAREKFYGSAEQHQRSHSTIWSNYGFCVYFPCLNDFQDCCQGQAAHCTVVVPILIISLCFVTAGTLPKHQLFDSAEAQLPPKSCISALQSCSSKLASMTWSELQRAQNQAHKHRVRFSAEWQCFLGSPHGRGQAVLLHTHASLQEMHPGAACRAACVCTNAIHTAAAASVSTILTFQLWMAGRGLHWKVLIKSADSNQPANLGLNFLFSMCCFHKAIKKLGWAQKYFILMLSKETFLQICFQCFATDGVIYPLELPNFRWTMKRTRLQSN